jgi:hypothetical protein
MNQYGMLDSHVRCRRISSWMAEKVLRTGCTDGAVHPYSHWTRKRLVWVRIDQVLCMYIHNHRESGVIRTGGMCILVNRQPSTANRRCFHIPLSMRLLSFPTHAWSCLGGRKGVSMGRTREAFRLAVLHRTRLPVPRG